MRRENLFGGTVLNRFTCWSLNALHVYDSLQCDCDNLDFFFFYENQIAKKQLYRSI